MPKNVIADLSTKKYKSFAPKFQKYCKRISIICVIALIVASTIILIFVSEVRVRQIQLSGRKSRSNNGI
ncbi:MAG TPA: hypothetical protein VH500_06970 [Nitrososphaeraceae archaeon]